MNVFIPYSDILKTIKSLDLRRANKQVLECETILRASVAEIKGYQNHPCTLMYKPYPDWLHWYKVVLKEYLLKGETSWLQELIRMQPDLRPDFIGYEPLHRAHRARLYQKDQSHYCQFGEDAKFTDLNWYIVGDQIKKYKNGKLIIVEKWVH